MKLAKNNKSLFFNLYSVIENLNETEYAALGKLLIVKRKKTKQNALLDAIYKRVQNGIVINYDNEQEIKAEIEKSLKTNNINHLIRNLYVRLLLFISEEFKKEEWKEWQFDANQRLLEIEALCNRKLYTQAIASLLNLEAKLKKNEVYSKWRWDDIGIYSRLANLKVQLLNIVPGLYVPEEIDMTLHHLLMTGEFFYNNPLNETHLAYFEKHKLLGYHLLSQFYIDRERYNDAIHLLEEMIKGYLYNPSENSNRDKVLLNYLKLQRLYLAVRQNDMAVVSEYMEKPLELTPLSSVILQEKIISDIVISKFLIGEIDSVPEELNIKYQYTHDKINETPLRIEINQSILYYLQNEYSKSLKLLRELKAKLKGTELYFTALWIEAVILLKHDPEADIDNVFRNIEFYLNKDKSKYSFEHQVIVIFKEWSKHGPDYSSVYWSKNESLPNEILNNSDRKNVLHNLILYALKINH